jgi:hypothetical protein
MANLTPFELFRIRLAGMLFATTYYSAHRSFLGARISSWIKWALFIFTFVVWITRQPPYLFILGAGAFIAVQFFYWYVKRQGYIRFLPKGKQPGHYGGELPADNKKIKVRATGVFSVSHHEAYVLQRPAEYWRVPVGDHAIMVQHEPGRFLYQFVQSGSLTSVVAGYLIFGRRPHEALAINFLTTRGPEFAKFTPKQFMSGANHTPAKLERTIYLTFDSAEVRHQVRQNLLRDVGKPLYSKV